MSCCSVPVSRNIKFSTGSHKERILFRHSFFRCLGKQSFGLSILMFPCVKYFLLCSSFTLKTIVQSIARWILGYVESRHVYTFHCSLPENMLSSTLTSNSLTQKYIHFIQLTLISVDTRPSASNQSINNLFSTIIKIEYYNRFCNSNFGAS